MLSKKRTFDLKQTKNGFIATVSVTLLASITSFLSIVALNLSLTYYDRFNREEIRIQTSFNARSCLDTATLMLSRDYFLFGSFKIERYGCSVNVINNFNGLASIIINAKLNDLSVKVGRTFVMTGFKMSFEDV